MILAVIVISQRGNFLGGKYDARFENSDGKRRFYENRRTEKDVMLNPELGLAARKRREYFRVFHRLYGFLHQPVPYITAVPSPAAVPVFATVFPPKRRAFSQFPVLKTPKSPLGINGTASRMRNSKSKLYCHLIEMCIFTIFFTNRISRIAAEEARAVTIKYIKNDPAI
jgi:hypothetical protein